MHNEAMKLLGKFYPPEGMYLEEISNFSTTNASVVGTFTVPLSAAYSIISLDYVTAEQHVRCFSQLSYALMFLLSKYHDGMTLYGSATDFEHLMLGGSMWYRTMDMHFVKQVKKGDTFSLHLEMVDIRKVKGFAVASLVAKGAVHIKSEFVAPIAGG